MLLSIIISYLSGAFIYCSKAKFITTRIFVNTCDRIEQMPEKVREIQKTMEFIK